MTAVEYLTSLAGPPLSALLLSQNIWLPFWVGLVSLGASAPLTMLLPRGSHRKGEINSKRDYSNKLSRPVREQTPETLPLVGASPSDEVEPVASSSLQALRQIFTSYQEILSHSRAFQKLLVVFFLGGAANATNVLLLQYISKRYGWTFAQVATPAERPLARANASIGWVSVHAESSSDDLLPHSRHSNLVSAG